MKKKLAGCKVALYDQQNRHFIGVVTDCDEELRTVEFTGTEASDKVKTERHYWLPVDQLRSIEIVEPASADRRAAGTGD